MAFQKGVSGNPGGRPRVVHEIRDLAQSHCAAAINRLVLAMSSPDDRIATAAACAILDRGIGRPVQHTELTGADGGPLETQQMTENEVARRIAHILHEELRMKAKGGEISLLRRAP